MASHRTAAVRFVLITVFLDVLGIGIAIPVLPSLVGALAGSRADQAWWYGVLGASYGLMQFACSPLLGALSDRFGRRSVLLLSSAGLGLNYLLTGLAPNLGILLVARLLGGATGASFSVATAYVADTTAPEERSRGIGMIGACFGLGFIIGPMLGGVLGGVNLHLPFFVAAALALLNTFYGAFVLPESLARELRRPVRLSALNPFSALLRLGLLREVGGLVLVFAFATLAQLILQSTWALYTSFRFGWGPRETGYTLFLVGVMAVSVQGGLLSRLTHWLGEVRLVMAGLASSCIAFCLYGLTTQGKLLFVVIVGNLLGYAVAPTLQAIVSRSVPADRQGVTMGSLQSINSLMFIVAPLLGTGLLARTSHLPPSDWRVGGTFLLGALCWLAALLLAWRHFRACPLAPVVPATLEAESAGQAKPSLAALNGGEAA
ncbi:MAG: TCR/Tet family MFS transporter [Pseudomonadota bacterium]|nr:TCR/Tet family MFS transporter [Pseudomonadota bacterium]